MNETLACESFKVSFENVQLKICTKKKLVKTQ